MTQEETGSWTRSSPKPSLWVVFIYSDSPVVMATGVGETQLRIPLEKVSFHGSDGDFPTFPQAELLCEVGLLLLQQPDVVLQSCDVLSQDNLQDETSTPQRGGGEKTGYMVTQTVVPICCSAAEGFTLMWVVSEERKLKRFQKKNALQLGQNTSTGWILQCTPGCSQSSSCRFTRECQFFPEHIINI